MTTSEPPTESDPLGRARRLTSWRPLGFLQDLVHTVAETRLAVAENRTILNQLEMTMADTSPLLNEVAADMARLGPAIAALVSENTRLVAERDTARGEAASARGEADTLRAEDTAETSAAQNVQTQWNSIAEKFTSAPEVPNVDPLPPVDGGGDAPAPNDGGTDVVNPTPNPDQPQG